MASLLILLMLLLLLLLLPILSLLFLFGILNLVLYSPSYPRKVGIPQLFDTPAPVNIQIYLPLVHISLIIFPTTSTDPFKAARTFPGTGGNRKHLL